MSTFSVKFPSAAVLIHACCGLLCTTRLTWIDHIEFKPPPLLTMVTDIQMRRYTVIEVFGFITLSFALPGPSFCWKAFVIIGTCLAFEILYACAVANDTSVGTWHFINISKPWFEFTSSVLFFSIWVVFFVDPRWRQERNENELLASPGNETLDPTNETNARDVSSTKDAVHTDQGMKQSVLSFLAVNGAGGVGLNPNGNMDTHVTEYVREFTNDELSTQYDYLWVQSFRAGSGKSLGDPICLTHRPLRHFLSLVVFKLALIGCYQATASFAEAMSTISSTHRQTETVLNWAILRYFLVYTAVTGCYQLVLKTVSLQIDRGKLGGPSFYVMGQLWVTLNYTLFYRSIFTQVQSVFTFLALVTIHCLFDWLMYGVRSTHWYYTATTRFWKRSVSKWNKNILEMFGMRNLYRPYSYEYHQVRFESDDNFVSMTRSSPGHTRTILKSSVIYTIIIIMITITISFLIMHILHTHVLGWGPHGA